MELGSITMILRTKDSLGVPQQRLTTTKFKTKVSAGKVMLTVSWNSEGIVLTDFLEKGATVHSEHYIETLKDTKNAPPGTGLQQTNARPHISSATSDAIAHLGFTVLPHPAYSQDLAPSNFHLFPKLKEDLRGHNFSSDEGKAAVCQWFQEEG
jgi:histone-lysine N-methyltransferase SETMAR